jgi:hypothetical protein
MRSKIKQLENRYAKFAACLVQKDNSKPPFAYVTPLCKDHAASFKIEGESVKEADALPSQAWGLFRRRKRLKKLLPFAGMAG